MRPYCLCAAARPGPRWRAAAGLGGGRPQAWAAAGTAARSRVVVCIAWPVPGFDGLLVDGFGHMVELTCFGHSNVGYRAGNVPHSASARRSPRPSGGVRSHGTLRGSSAARPMRRLAKVEMYAADRSRHASVCARAIPDRCKLTIQALVCPFFGYTRRPRDSIREPGRRGHRAPAPRHPQPASATAGSASRC
jgi:hypothetical protein